ncbi:MAG: hypothetical protein JSR46_04375 [Verrucomicrobia bacterium]|nr:hypothetical protein [Verrucomicrobiota bacterium]
MKISMISLMILFLAPLTGEEAKPSLFDKMDEQTRNATGIVKLSTEEKASLEAWLKSDQPMAEPPKKSTESVPLEGEIIAVANNGLRFTLKNGESYDVCSHYKRKAKGWKTGDKIRIVQSKKPVWYKFENESGQIIGVKKICQPTSQNQ